VGPNPVLVYTMELYGVLRFINVVLVLTTTVVQFTTAEICYGCTDDPDDSDNFPPYDAECAQYDYRGHANDWGSDGCSIKVYDNGYITRMYASGHEDGDCVYGSGYTECFCTGVCCNTDSFCEHCTGLTTEDTTVTITTSSSTTSPATLKCYECINCDNVDDATPVIEGEYMSCVTTIMLESGEVIRGGSSEEHPDGECSQNAATLSCWCSKDICNGNTIDL
ncbi:unnamed protein product, partial [Meganyctiphanes norvegica]